jgi:hypothetical protein
MAPIVKSVEVAVPPQTAFDYVTDPARFAEWQQGVAGGHMEGDGPPRVGGLCMTTRRIGFAERPVASEITHVDRPTAWGVRGVDGPIRATVNVTVAALDDGRRARVTIQLDFTGHGVGKLLVPLVVRPGAGREMDTNMRRLRERLQAGA